MRSPVIPVQTSSPSAPRRRLGPVAAAVVAVALSVTMVACSDSDPNETPAPGGTESPSGEVRAPNGTSMDATPINAGTAAGG
ncbi:MAG: hypothetical protein ABW122_10090 [Ilumatobacteraceae bacterium]